MAGPASVRAANRRIGPFPAFLLSIALLSAGVSAVPVEVRHPVYGLLRRLSNRGLIERPFLGSLPLQAREVLRLLRSAGADSASLSAWERREVELHLREFDPQLRSRDTRLYYGDSARRLSGRVDYFLGGYYRDSLPRADAFAFTSAQAGLEGAFGEKVEFVSQASVGGERLHHPRYLMNYDPQRGLPYNTREGRTDPTDLDESSTFDAFRTVAGFHEEHWSLEAGNDWNQWGPGVWQHPSFGASPWFWTQDSLPGNDSSGFSGAYLPGAYRRGLRYPGEGPTLNQVRLVFTWPLLRYTKVVAERTGLIKNGRAFLVAHRLEARLGRFDIGAYEMVGFAGRSFEAIYAIPFVPLKIAEHHQGDRDNIALGLDVNWAARPWLRLYSELFLDDLLGPLDLFGDYWGNKFAFVVGGEAYDLLLPASSLQAEYARVEPWLYGHHVYNNQLQHLGSLLGSGIPPNSQAFRLRWWKSLGQGVELGAEYGLLQRQVRDPGSSIFDVHVDSLHGRTKEFLGDDPETRNALRIQAGYRHSRFAEIRGAAGFLHVAQWKGGAGKNLATPTLEAEVRLRY